MEGPQKRILSENERAELAAKLDKDCDDFMEELAANQKNEPKKPFNFDEWCKEYDNHPAFMDNFTPSADGELPTAIQALQSLKYDNEGEDLLETATNHKDEGNKHFKFKKYRWAIDSYTEGAKLMVPDRKLNAVIYCNRATAHKYLGNYSSGLKDSLISLKFDPLHTKAMIRCCELLSEFEKSGRRALKFATDFIAKLETPPDGREKEFAEAKEKLEALRKVAAERVEKDKIEASKRQAALLRDLQKKEKIVQMFKRRKLQFTPDIDFNNYREFEWTMLDVNFPNRPTTRVDFEHGTDTLEWPIMLQYPEVGQTDFLTECPENYSIRTLIEPVLEFPAEWDRSHVFKLSNVRLFIALDVFDDEQVRELLLEETLGDVLSTKDHVIVQGLPVIQIYTNDYIAKKLAPMDNKLNVYRFFK